MAAIGFVLIVLGLAVMAVVRGPKGGPSPAPNTLFFSFLTAVVGAGFVLASLTVLLWRYLP